LTSPAEQSPKQKRAYLAWVAVSLSWGTTFLAARIAIESFPPLLMAGTRHIAAGALLAAWVRSRGIDFPARDAWPGHALLGVLMIGAGNGCLIWAQQFVPSGMASVMVSLIPFWMVGVEALMPAGEPLRARHLAGLLIGFAGILLLTSSGAKIESASDRQFLYGVLAIQGSGCGWAVGSAYAKRHNRHEDVFAATAVQMIFGGAWLVLVGTLANEWPDWHYTLRSTLAFLYLVFVGSLIGYVSYTYALKYLPVSIVSLYAYVNPIIAVVLGAVILNEPFTPRMVMAIAVIFAAMWIVRPGSPRTRADTSHSSREPV
jgi:drug/metabolite transporter (DMT)-like permease